MNQHIEKVKGYILELGYDLTHLDEEDGVFVIKAEHAGINDLVIGIADPLVIFEQFIFEIKNESIDVYRSLLKKNRDIIHGSFVLDESGTKVIFRDTLQVENLDMNEFEGTINSLSLLLSEYSQELINFSHK